MKLTTLIKQLSLFFALFLSLNCVMAQQIEACGTIMTPESERYLQDIQPQIKQYEREFYNLQAQRNSSTAITSVPVKAHVLRTDAGTGGLTEAQVNSAFAIMNAYYANANLEFFLCEGINFINNSTFYNFTISEEADLRAAYNVDNVINIYFANEVTNSNNNGLCGYAYFPGGPEVIMMNNNCAMNGSTLSHEMGHFLGLSHTHGNSNTTLTNELVNGSNCESAGDFICDTPADPQLSGSNVTAACNYIGVEFDANGDQFQPNPLNIMSYSRKSCRTEFSTGQYARAYAVYQASRASMACPSFSVNISSNFTPNCGNTLDVAFTDNSVGATSWQWDVDGDDVIDYTTQNPSHTYTSSGIYDVALTISNGTESITKVYQEYIEVGGEDISTSEVVLTLFTDDWPAETSWSFSDSSGNVLYSSPTYVEGVDDFQTFTENFIVATNECYTFEIFDSYGDGICCFSGLGSYTLETLEGDVIAAGGDYGFYDNVLLSNDVLSVDDYFANNSISVYPNPTNDILNIGISNSSDLPDHMNIYNVLGQIIASKRIDTLNDMMIDATNFADGVYYIKIEKGSQATTIPFIKQ